MSSKTVYCILNGDLGWHRHIARFLSSVGFRVCDLADKRPPSTHEGIVVGIGRAESEKVVPESIDDVTRHLAQRRRQYEIRNRFLLFDPFLVPFDGFDASRTLQQKKNEIRNAGAVLIDSVPDLSEAVKGTPKPISESQRKEIIQPELAKESMDLHLNLTHKPTDKDRRQAENLIEKVCNQLSEEEAENLRSKNTLDAIASVPAHLNADRNHAD